MTLCPKFARSPRPSFTPYTLHIQHKVRAGHHQPPYLVPNSHGEWDPLPRCTNNRHSIPLLNYATARNSRWDAVWSVELSLPLELVLLGCRLTRGLESAKIFCRDVGPLFSLSAPLKSWTCTLCFLVLLFPKTRKRRTHHGKIHGAIS